MPHRTARIRDLTLGLIKVHGCDESYALKSVISFEEKASLPVSLLEYGFVGATQAFNLIS